LLDYVLFFKKKKNNFETGYTVGEGTISLFLQIPFPYILASLALSVNISGWWGARKWREVIAVHFALQLQLS